MGGRNSCQYFEKCVQSLTTALRYHFPEVFLEQGKIKKVFSWVDDFMFSSTGRGVAEALRNAAIATGIYWAVCAYVGMVLSPTKDKPPLQTQCILGLTLDTECNKLALKAGKAEALALLAKKMQGDNSLSISDLRSLEGNIM